MSLRRFSAQNRCPICQGHEGLPRGHRQRCAGFLSSDGRWAFCTREERAGSLDPAPNTEPTAYRHPLHGPCGCGEEHGPVDRSPAAGSDRFTEWLIRDFDGHVVARHVRKDPTAGAKTYFWKQPDGSSGLNGAHPSAMLYGAELVGRYPEAKVLIVEGEKARDAVQSVLGAGWWIVVANVCGAPNSFGDAVADRLRGRSTTLWADADPPDEKGVLKGQLQADRHGELLEGRAERVHLVHWPEAPPKGDAADYCATHDRDQVLDLLADAQPWTPGLAQRLAGGALPSTPSNGNGARGGGGELPKIIVSGDLPAMTEAAAAALAAANDPSRLFTRAGELVRIVNDPDQGHVIRSLELDGLRGELARCARWLARSGAGELKRTAPPVHVVRDLASLAVPGAGSAPPLLSLIEAPALRPDGSVIDRLGYDRATHLFFAGSGPVPSVPDRPSRDQCCAAVEVLDDVLCDFPFDSEASKAGSIALFITTIIRAALGDRPAPMCLLDAPKQGTGKSLLAKHRLPDRDRAGGRVLLGSH